MKIAVIGATGLVGQKILEVLTERNFPVDELYPVASERSKGKKIRFRGKEVTIIGMKEAIELKPHIAIFSAGGTTSLEWAPEFEKAGIFVVDNSSAWRMHPEKKLIVPEINASELTVDDKIIANPNCSTIQMVVALAPLHKKYKIKRLIISTYQSISGTGIKAVEQLENERAGIVGEMAYPHPIDKNCLPHCDVFEDNAYTKEEMKLINETRKILCDDSIRITATAVRVPVVGGHSESVNIEFEKDFDLDELKDLLANSEGIILQDDPENNIYPMPRFAHEKNEVFVGRIRRDFSNPNSLNMWIVADNLRKGAATNAIQIAEYLTKNGIV
tara:strand:+ start:2459 stop:3448 length:990 start_codon:yes stop_codon:yes gene_type:complete